MVFKRYSMQAGLLNDIAGLLPGAWGAFPAASFWGEI